MVSASLPETSAGFSTGGAGAQARTPADRIWYVPIAGMTNSSCDRRPGGGILSLDHMFWYGREDQQAGRSVRAKRRRTMATVTIVDEVLPGDKSEALTLEFLDERVTVREVIRSRVYQEVTEYNARLPEHFRGLVQPTDAERVLNGYRLRQRRKIDWQEQYRRAVEAFQRNGFLVLVDDMQVNDLDQGVDLRHDSTVTFLKLVPLVGG
jgi:hypothetical protein